MPSISPLIVRIFDDPHANHRRHEIHAKRSRLESKGRCLGLSEADPIAVLG